LLGGQAAQLVVDQGQQLPRGGRVALLDGLQDPRDLVHHRRVYRPSLSDTTKTPRGRDGSTIPAPSSRAANSTHALLRIVVDCPCACHFLNSVTNCCTASSVFGCPHICGKNFGGTVRISAPACIASLMSAMWRILPTMISAGDAHERSVFATALT